MADDLAPVYARIAHLLRVGRVVPVLGAGANLVERPPDATWRRGRYLPSGSELAQELARYVRIGAGDAYDLARVSQYLSAVEGEGALYDELHDVFDADYPPTAVHHFLAAVAARIRAEKQEGLLCVTTNYDVCLEAAFTAVGEPYELITYIAKGKNAGHFLHVRMGGEPTVIEKPNEYLEFTPGVSVIAKIHGAVDREGGEDSFVITEDHYVRYITHADVGSLFPTALAARMRRSHFLFLGYSLRDWDFRVMLYRLWGEQEGKTYKSWAIDAYPDLIDRVAWETRGVDILAAPLEDFLVAMQREFAEIEGRTP